MIKCSNITKSYGSTPVLRGIDLTIDRGEIVAIVGKSGAGKSTLLQILGTLTKADAGLIEIDSIRVNDLRGDALARFRSEKIGFVFQFHHLLPEFSALENVAIPALIARRNKTQSMARARELLEMLNLGDRLEHRPAELSGGEQQRVAVARALINNPSVIFADEPSGNLDTTNRGELHALFFSLRERFGQTFVIVTHDAELASNSDRQIIIRDGIIIQP